MKCLRRPTEHALHMYIQLDKVHDMDRCQMDSRATHTHPETKGEKKTKQLLHCRVAFPWLVILRRCGYSSDKHVLI